MDGTNTCASNMTTQLRLTNSCTACRVIQMQSKADPYSTGRKG